MACFRGGAAFLSGRRVTGGRVYIINNFICNAVKRFVYLLTSFNKWIKVHTNPVLASIMKTT